MESNQHEYLSREDEIRSESELHSIDVEEGIEDGSKIIEDSEKAFAIRDIKQKEAKMSNDLENISDESTVDYYQQDDVDDIEHQIKEEYEDMMREAPLHEAELEGRLDEFLEDEKLFETAEVNNSLKDISDDNAANYNELDDVDEIEHEIGENGGVRITVRKKESDWERAKRIEEERYQAREKEWEIKRKKAEEREAAERKALIEEMRLDKEKREAEKRAKDEEERRKNEDADRIVREKEEAQRALMDNPPTREEEINRLRHEWSDGDMDIEIQINEIRKDLALLEVDFQYLDNEYNYMKLMKKGESTGTMFDLKLKQCCKDNNIHYCTTSETSYENRYYRDENGQQKEYAAVTVFCEIKKKLWEEIENKLPEIERQREIAQKKYETIQNLIAYEERKREIHKMKYEEKLRSYGTSLDPFKMCMFNREDDFWHSEDALFEDVVLPGLPIRMVACVAGRGAIGKTQYVTQLGFYIACGRNGWKKGGVLFISGEDNKAFLKKRRSNTLSHLVPAFSESELADISANFISWYLEGMRADLTDAQSDDTLAFMRNLKVVERHFRDNGIQLRLIVLDTLSNFNAGKENQPEQTALLLDTLNRICLETGASLIFIHHTTKTSTARGESETESVRGHSSLGYNVKWVTILNNMTEKEARDFGINPAECSKYVKTSLAKHNIIPEQLQQWYKIDEHGIFVPIDLVCSVTHSDKEERPKLNHPVSKPNITNIASESKLKHIKRIEG